MGRRQADGEETKRRIVDKAGQLFAEKGFNAVTMNEICECATVSKGSLYHHFPGKDELLLYVLEVDAKQWRQRWEDRRAELLSTEEQLFLLAEQYANDFQNPLSKALEEFARSRVISDEVFKRIWTINDITLQACRTVIQEGMERGELARGELDEKVIIISSMLEGLGKTYYMYDREKEQDTVKAIYRKAVHLLLDGIRAGGSC
ncbi:TetR/AcrR family transcriptional regulator [Paenibacillus hodogayensis]|uniref:TetR/AcrR family transcriptional regulator n=1 Tax=Paenibacillus hodogayensis TaxID=279208 RepID=A0ABV5W1E5_9BACL